MKRKKILIGSIIVAMFVMFSSSSALDVDTQNKDDIVYIITKISGSPWTAEIQGFGIFRELTATAPQPGLERINIESMIISEGRLTCDIRDVEYIQAPHFIGFYRDGGQTMRNIVFGFALGEIEWS